MIKNINIKELSEEDRPREKLINIGAENLSDKEILAIILRTGTKNTNVIDLANNILNTIGGINNLKYVTYNELIKYKGVGTAKAIDILATLELSKRIFTEKINDKIICNNPSVIANHYRFKLQQLTQEIFLVIDIDTKGKIITEREVFKGSLSNSIIHPREIFKDAIRNSSASIICIHNHPSGDATPSIEDLEITEKLIKAGKILGIEVLDHIIIAKKGYCSIAKFRKIIKDKNYKIESLNIKTINQITNENNLIDKYI